MIVCTSVRNACVKRPEETCWKLLPQVGIGAESSRRAPTTVGTGSVFGVREAKRDQWGVEGVLFAMNLLRGPAKDFHLSRLC